MPTPDVLERFIAKVESNAHAEAIEQFYTADASMQENDLEPRRGRDLLAAHERKVLARMRSVRSRCVRPVLANGDIVVIRWIFEFERLDGGRLRIEELAWQRWEGERIAEEKFFYDPRQLEPPLFEAGAYRAMEVGHRDVPRLQRFLESNPEYYLAVNGLPPAPGEALEELESPMPAGFPHGKKWVLQVVGAQGEIVAMANVVSNLFAEGVWHIGLFIVATSLHGTGAAHAIYEAIEKWMRAGGARWIRLGVVEGNRRGERFWERVGFVDVRRRLAVPMGAKVNDLRVMMKPLAGGTGAEYLAVVARDRPESP